MKFQLTLSSRGATRNKAAIAEQGCLHQREPINNLSSVIQHPPDIKGIHING
jgi:hypothetical protein